MGWVIGVAYTLVYMFIIVNKLTYTWLVDKNSPYCFDEKEMKRFNVDKKLEKLKK